MRNVNLFLMAFALMAATAFSVSAASSEISVVLDQNFDAFTEGSQDEPATVDISSYSSGKLSTILPGWTGQYVYEAGGCLKIGASGNLRTASTDMSSGGGNLRITFKVKTLDNVGAIDVQLGYNTAKTFYVYDSEWTTIEYITNGGRATSFLNFKPSFVVNGMLIDDLKVETSESFLAAPEVNQPIQADGVSFTALWKSVTGATGYLLDVYTKDGDNRVYTLQDYSVTGTSHYVSDLDATKTYFYTVRAVKDDIISAESEEVEVVKNITSLDAPVALDATAVTENGFTAHWEAVPDATRYEVNVTRHEILAQDAVVNVIDEDFSKVTSGTITSVDYPSTQEYLDAYTQQPGWYGYAHCLASGYMGLAPFGTAATITTPSLNLSNNNGTFQLKVNMVSRNYSGAVEGDTVMVNIYNGNDLVESVKLTLGGDFADYTVTSDKGNDNTFIELSYLNGSDKLFIDYFVVSQQLMAGDVVAQPVGVYEADGDATSIAIDLPLSDKLSYTYNVVAYAPTVVSSYYGNYVDEIASSPSNEIEVKLNNTSISKVAVATSIGAVPGAIVINSAIQAPVIVYNLSGQVASRGIAKAGTTTINLAPGIYVVKAGDMTQKVLIK